MKSQESMTEKTGTTATERPSVQSLERALDLLETLGKAEGALPLGELARRVNLHKSTVYRLLQTLGKRGYVTQDADGRYRLGLRIVGLSSALLDSLDLREEARPYLQQLLAQTNEVVHLVVMEQGEMVYIEKLEGTQTVRMHSLVGKRVPAHCTGVGKAILAYLPSDEVEHILQEKGMPAHTPKTITDLPAMLDELARVRAQGYAIDNEENEEGIICIAAPIYDYRNRVIAAISLSAPSMRMGTSRVESLIPLVKATAANISAHFGASGQGAAHGASLA